MYDIRIKVLWASQNWGTDSWHSSSGSTVVYLCSANHSEINGASGSCSWGWHNDAPRENFRFYCLATEWYEVIGGKHTKREESFKTRKIIGDLQEPFLGQSDKKSDKSSDKKPSFA